MGAVIWKAGHRRRPAMRNILVVHVAAYFMCYDRYSGSITMQQS